MTKFEPKKHHLRELLIYFFNLKKSAAEAHRLLVEAYNEAALSERTCREWFQKFKNGDFDVEDKDCNGKPKIYEDAELEELLVEDSSQTQKELALTIEITQQSVSHRLKWLRMIHKQGTKKGFYIKWSLVTKSIHYDNPKRRKSWGLLDHASTSTAKPNIHGKKLMLYIWWDQLGVVYYVCLIQAKQSLEFYRTQLMRLNRALKEKRPQYYSRLDKIILLHDNASPHVMVPVKNYLKTLVLEVLPHPPNSPDIALFDYHLFRSMAHVLREQRFTSYQDTKNCVDSWIASKDKESFRLGIRMLPERWKKVVASDRQYFD
ncbi:Mariner Mos1 transposase [Eumeta japonica]|uniref:Mariner Mos1 transposase n=1 Tax=Eumeta variegata TaxID=151549 RepID=A0A4C1XMR0_EUMVA|nr:Mariner Mos1 transposase [Eumeta japonica]